MATLPSLQTVSNTLLTKAPNGITQAKPYKLPNGPCNFTNLAVAGVSPPRCGCQRFWDQLEYTQTPSGRQLASVIRKRAGWCMCEHHACFHECLPARSSTSHQGVTSNTSRSLSQRTRKGESSSSSRFPSQFTEYLPPQVPVPVETELSGACGGTNSQSQANKHLTESGLPDTALSDGLAQPESIGPGLPPIPSQCNLPPDLSSGGLIGNSQSFQSFPRVNYFPLVDKHLGNDAVQLTQPGQSMILPSHNYTYDEQFPSGFGQADSFVQSATDVITPRSYGSPDPGLEHGFDNHVASVHAAIDILTSKDNQRQQGRSKLPDVDHPSGYSPPNSIAIATKPITDAKNSELDGVDEHAPLLVRQLLPHLQTILSHVSAHPTLSTRMQNHEQRIDLLENVSCSYASAQEVRESFDLVDERIGEVESRVEELEKGQAALNDLSGITRFHRRLRAVDDGDSSMASQTSSELISAAIERTEFSARLDDLESQFTEFRSSNTPSRARPWEVEVVFLPFGTNLKGIWSASGQLSSQRSRNNSTAADNRTQSQFSSLGGTYHLTSDLRACQERWEDMHPKHEQTDEWLVAKACAQGSKVEERLRSRGLVKMIKVMGPGARDVQVAMLAAFGDLTEDFHITSSHAGQQLPDSFSRFFGLQAFWIPLRKVHKDSRLRYLDPSEMVTPALWTTSFLSSSVVMRATGIKRLYITQRESYIQQAKVLIVDWTWQQLRVLPRVSSYTETSTEVREADALEACWEWDERLDPPQSVHSSFTSQHSSLNIQRAPSQISRSSQSNRLSSPAISPVPSTTPTSVAHTRNISSLKERPHLLHSRTTSMPSMVPLKILPAPGKRRIASFGDELHSASPPQSSPVRPSAGFGLKRRRISRSPSRPRDTPRWSVGPPSPYCLEELAEQRRGTTPFAYATPHSNATYGDFRPYSVASVGVDNQDEHGGTTDEFGLDGEEQDVDEFDSAPNQERQLEYEVWEGVGDEMGDDESDQEQNALSIGEGSDDANAMSDLSSQPSEYPSTQPSAFYTSTKSTFQIHVDDDEENAACDNLHCA